MARSKQEKSEHKSEILPIQVKMARAALGWGVRDLMAAAKISGDTVNRLEQGEQLRERTIAAVRDALEKAGVVFIEENGSGPGVRLKPKRARRRPSVTIEPYLGGDDEEERSIEDAILPENRRSAFLLRAGEAIRFGAYDGPVNVELVKVARRVARHWLALAHAMEENGGGPGVRLKRKPKR